MVGFALALGLDADWFDRELTHDATVLFRIFHYPPLPLDAPPEPGWGVAEHTDYGLLTILVQDETGGLELRTHGEWISVPPQPDALVCNLGDMLERMTGGRYRSTPHRAHSPRVSGRISCPFFFDPGWDAEVRAIVDGDIVDDSAERWDGTSVFDFDGTYGDYLLGKVSKVFPDLKHQALE
jgi:isopenicillin N synthase-like dioxygenase